MTGEVYRKRGRTVRYEAGHLLTIAEGGEAIEDGDFFECHPLAEENAVATPDAQAVADVARRIEGLAQAPVAIERLIVSEGIAEHQFGERRWRETFRRVHVAVTCGRLRALVDRGDFAIADIARIIALLPQVRTRRGQPPRARMAPNVAAAIIPALVGTAPPNVRLVQSAGGFDGKGEPVVERAVGAAQWANWYRPSYRARPVRAPINVRLECDVEAIDDDLPEAIAILAPVRGLLIDVLCVHRGDVYPAELRISRVEAVAKDRTWFPYGAGSFGAVTVV